MIDEARLATGIGRGGPAAHWLDFFRAAPKIRQALQAYRGIPDHHTGMATPGPPTVQPTFSFATNEAWIYKGLPIRVVNTSTGLRAFYRRDGRGGIRPYGAQVGDWAPFLGFSPHQLIKPPSAVSPTTPPQLYRWGNQEAYEANLWLKAQPEAPALDVGDSWGIIQMRLEELGVFVEFPLGDQLDL